jgi:hypothetical protein
MVNPDHWLQISERSLLKLQTPKKLQVPSSKAASLRQVLELAVWDFSGAWCLEFGVS